MAAVKVTEEVVPMMTKVRMMKSAVLVAAMPRTVVAAMSANLEK